MDASLQTFNWSHSPIGNEDYWHKGTLNSYILNPALTIGLSDYFNLTISQAIGVRIMDYNEVSGVDPSAHHRDEGTHTNFKDQAHGGILGDTRLLLRYLILNDGMKGNRLFVGTGLIIPSQNRLLKNPFAKDNDGNYDDHRHFSMSEGTYQLIGELQFFRKLSPPIIFWGISSYAAYPIKATPEGYLSPLTWDVSLTFLTKKIKFINASLGLYMQYKYSGPIKWDEVEITNSEAKIINPGFGFIWTTKNKLGISLNILNPQIMPNSSLTVIESNIENNIDSWQVNLGIRKTFDYSIPFLE